MLYIGYIYEYDKWNLKGKIVDSSQNLHEFTLKETEDFHKYQFVTFNEDNGIVKNIIPLSSYRTSLHADHYLRRYVHQGISSNRFIVDDNNTRYEAEGEAEHFILNRLYEHKPLEPLLQNTISDFELSKRVQQIVDNVEFVSSHLQEIADSYREEVIDWYYSKPGGDDRSGTKRVVELSYRDTYVNQFFPSSEELYEESGYSVEFQHSIDEGRQIWHENLCKSSFLSNYNKKEHYAVLIKELLQHATTSLLYKVQDNYFFAAYWGIFPYFTCYGTPSLSSRKFPVTEKLRSTK